MSVTCTNNANRRNEKLTFKSKTLFRLCLTKVFNTFVGNAKDLDIVMLIYNLLEYSDNYSITSGSLWNYYQVDDNVNKINNNKTRTTKSDKYKTKVKGSTPDKTNRLNAEVVVPLKYLSNFWRSLDLSLINCEIELDLRWTINCVIPKVSRTFRVVPNADPVAYEMEIQTTSATFQINNANLHVRVVALPINGNIKILEYITQEFKRTISWNKYRSEVTKQPKSNNLGYLIDATFRNINRLFVLSFKNGKVDLRRSSFDKYYVPLV